MSDEETFVDEVLESEESETDEEVLQTNKSLNEIALEVIQGQWGEGQARRKALTKAGYDPREVQKEIVKIYNKT